MEPSAPAAAAVPAGLELASFGRRIGGALVDQVLVLAPVVIVAFGVGWRPGDEIDTAALLWAEAATAVIAFAYETLMVGRWGRTVGKFAAGTRVVDATDGGRLGWYAAAQRAVVPLVAGAVPGLGLLLASFVYGRAFFDPLRRGIHDRAAGSLVVGVS